MTVGHEHDGEKGQTYRGRRIDGRYGQIVRGLNFFQLGQVRPPSLAKPRTRHFTSLALFVGRPGKFKPKTIHISRFWRLVARRRLGNLLAGECRPSLLQSDGLNRLNLQKIPYIKGFDSGKASAFSASGHK